MLDVFVGRHAIYNRELEVIAYELLTGVYPYDASSHARLLTQHLHQPLPAHPLLTDEVLRILQKATAKQPDERYDTNGPQKFD